MFFGFEILVAGYGTEALGSFESSIVKIIGSMDSIDELILQCRVLLINQQNSSGALTKIDEFIQYGYQINCNSDSRRSYFDYDQIIEYDNLEELAGLLNMIKCNHNLKKGVAETTDKILKIKKIINDEFIHISAKD